MDLYRINLNLLVALDMLFEERSVTRAAKKLFITQAALSNNLLQLRKIFGDELLVREKNHMVLTSFADDLRPKLHRLLEEMRCVISSGQQFEPEKSTRVFKIGMTDYLSVLILPKLLCTLQKKAPNVKLDIISEYHVSSVEPFENEKYDMVVGKVVDVGSPIERTLLFKDTAVCIMNPKHPLAKQEEITLEEYLSYKHIAIRADNPSLPAVIEQALAKCGMERDKKISVPFASAIFTIIEHSSAPLIGTILKSTADSFQKRQCVVVKAVPFKIEPVEFYLAWHRRFDNDPGHRWLREQILALSKDFGLSIAST